MEIKERLLQIKALLFGAEPAPAPAPEPAPAPAVTDYKLKDGSVVSIDKLEVGGIVTVNSEPAADGEYVLEDGTNISVSGGVISELESPAAEGGEGAMPEEMKTPAQMMAAIQKFAEPGATPDVAKMALILKACFEYTFGWQLREAQEKATRDAAIQAYQTGFNEHKEAQKLMFELVEQIANSSETRPEEEPTAWENMTPLQRFRAQKAKQN